MIKKEELDVLRSVATVTKEPMNGDNSDLFGKYVGTKMRKMTQKLDEDATESVEYDITIVLMKARNETGPVQTWLKYYYF